MNCLPFNLSSPNNLSPASAPVKLRCVLLWTAVGLLCSGCAGIVRPNYTQQLTELRSGQYTLDPEHAYVNFTVDHLGLSKIVGRFNAVSASMDFDPAMLTSMSVEGRIVAASVDVNNNELEDMLRERSWLDTGKYPEIRFISTGVSAGSADTPSNTFMIAGDLSLRGVTRPVELDATFNGGADNFLTGKYTLGFMLSTTIKRSEFGMDAFAALVGDDVQIEIHGEFQRN